MSCLPLHVQVYKTIDVDMTREVLLDSAVTPNIDMERKN